jgi:hypothetical protein
MLAEHDSRYDPACHMLTSTFHGVGYHSTVAGGSKVHETQGSLLYAILCIRAGEQDRVARGERALAAVLDLQDTDPCSRTYGVWPWMLEEPLSQMRPPDLNWADFCGMMLCHLLDHLRTRPGAVSPPLSARTRESLAHAAWAIFRRNVRPNYTNICALGAAVTTVAGELLGESRLLQYGRRRLHDLLQSRLHNGGFTEYNSPTYNMVTLHACEQVLQLSGDVAARDDAETLRRIIWSDIAEHFHPGTGQWAGPHSRTYWSLMLPDLANQLSRLTGAPIAAHARTPQGKPLRGNFAKHLPCPPDIAPRFAALPAPEVETKSTFVRGVAPGVDITGTTWMCDDACLGSVSHDSTWTQRRPLIAYWRMPDAPPAVLRLRLLKDGRDFASGLIHAAQTGPRVLAAVSLLLDMGDYHLHLDRRADNTFEMEDLRLRYELTAPGASVSGGSGAFVLSAGARAATVLPVVDASPADDAAPVTWESSQGDGWVGVDGVIYRGPRRAIHLASVGQLVLAAALELGWAGRPAALAPPAATCRDGMVYVEWPSAASPLRVAAPLRARAHDGLVTGFPF